MSVHTIKLEITVESDEKIEPLELLLGNILALLNEVRPDLVVQGLNVSKIDLDITHVDKKVGC